MANQFSRDCASKCRWNFHRKTFARAGFILSHGGFSAKFIHWNNQVYSLFLLLQSRRSVIRLGINESLVHPHSKAAV